MPVKLAAVWVSLITSVTATLALVVPPVSDTVALRLLSLELIAAALTATVWFW